MIWNIIGIAIIIGFVVFSGMEWYISLGVGIVVAAIVVIVGGFIKGKINQ
tara:strand:- start:459 stop:608 length:150 start_codon:yes stop_codon:yes gene_type:complete